MVQDCENVVRFLRDNEVKPQRRCHSSAFKLRKTINETYISVDRTCLPTFEQDALSFDKNRDSFCAVLNVGTIRELTFSYQGHIIAYDVKSEPSHALSHGGIYILYDGEAVVGGSLDSIDDNLIPGQEKSVLTNAVRSRLARLASNRIFHVQEVIGFSKEDQCLKNIDSAI